MGWDAPWHWIVLAVLVIALFGYKKLPDAARAMGRSLRIFKTEIKGMTEDDKARDARDARDAAPRSDTATPSVIDAARTEPPVAQPAPVASPVPPATVEPTATPSPVTTPQAAAPQRPSDDATPHDAT